jgi:hypothetical protein
MYRMELALIIYLYDNDFDKVDYFVIRARFILQYDQLFAKYNPIHPQEEDVGCITFRLFKIVFLFTVVRLLVYN